MEQLPATRGVLILIVLAVVLVAVGVPVAEWLWPVAGGILLTAALVDVVRQELQR